MSITTVTHHDVTFIVNTDDWTNEKSSQIAREAMIDGITALSYDDVQRIALAWSDEDAASESRNAGDDVCQTIEAIEHAAYLKGIEGWVSTPDHGHNCDISLTR